MDLLILNLLVFASAAVQSGTKTKSSRPKDFVTSKADRMELLLLDRELISNLVQYTEELQNKVHVLQRFSMAMSIPLEAAKGREEEYLSNPLHSFRLIRHMHEDWRQLEKFMRQPGGQDQINFLKEKTMELASREDAEDATEAIYRIVRTYDVQPAHLVEGLIDGVQYNGSISAIDCFSLGTLHFQWGEYDKAAQFLSFSLEMVEPEYYSVYDVLGFASSEVFMLLARCLVEMDLEDDARTTLMAHPTLADHSERLLTLYTNTRHVQVSEELKPDLTEGFKKICRSSHQNKPSRLHCRYNATTTPFLRLAPLRMEELSLHPYIVVYHNVVSDAEIAELERVAEPLLVRAEFGDMNMNLKYKVRTALGAWIPDYVSGLPVVQRVLRRIHDMTGLIMTDHQFLQLIKYGFGGHYDLHFDYFNSTQPITQAMGDRMATVLFYLNDARHGGATVFSHLQLKVPSERGKVLCWYNMRGETHDLDMQTEHGACPVIDGTKTVLSCWIHEWDQMFIQPTYVPGNRTFFNELFNEFEG
ncbi:prolyl 4-hydroxylase subunit alpha-2-like isoform X2 [Drosophila obscura]|uniref:prolyl 4-hydroxylase subunit alpha-2-like isoform X2 n=1 Tax=Drosophila obscura TaxID=7282 RepID=UPI001BB1214C|nr:prolyl 4-hydroxylase subunit alpha-2-like isoform X2 [Drosophila obscura]